MKNALQLKQFKKKKKLFKIKTKSQIIYSRDSAELNAVVWVTRGQKRHTTLKEKTNTYLYT